jgi:hypothetical protein
LFTDGESGGRSGRPPSISAYVDVAWLGPTEVVPGSYARGHRQDQEDSACTFNSEVEYNEDDRQQGEDASKGAVIHVR